MTAYDPYAYSGTGDAYYGPGFVGSGADPNAASTTVHVGYATQANQFCPPASMTPQMLACYQSLDAWTGGGATQATFQHSPYAQYNNGSAVQYAMTALTTGMSQQPSPTSAGVRGGALPAAAMSTRSNGSGTGNQLEKKYVYRHNPYASDPSTPTSQGSGFYHSQSTENFGSFGDFPPTSPVLPVYEASCCTDPSTYPVAHGIAEQFGACVGHICEAACSTRGRNILTQVIRMQHVDKIQIIFDEVLQGIDQVASDPHGAHVLRLLVEYLPDGHVAQLCLNLSKEMIVRLATASQNTRRVLQALFENHQSPELQYVVDVICENCYVIATQQQGCIAVMRVMDFATDSQRHELLNSLAPHFAALAMDPFGNYVIQAALPHIDHAVLDQFLLEAFDDQWIPLSCNKFGSNVMEKTVGIAGTMLRDVLRRELCYNPKNMHVLMQDGYGNFVLQALIDVSAGTADGRKICELARPLLHTSPYGHKIEAKLRSKRLLSSSFNRANQMAQQGGGHAGRGGHHNNHHHNSSSHHAHGHSGIDCHVSSERAGDNSSNASQSAEAQAQ